MGGRGYSPSYNNLMNKDTPQQNKTIAPITQQRLNSAKVNSGSVHSVISNIPPSSTKKPTQTTIKTTSTPGTGRPGSAPK